ncbi:MAG: NAD(+)/NADH kinase [Anaerolineae bacterium]|nr:NAD(+)/NADH kinase [Anaerolineae bacterium]
MLKRVGILGHPLRPETGEVGEQVARSLQERNIDIWQRLTWDAAAIKDLIAESDMVVAIGGDGSMLRAARICARANVPVFGINTGHLGFLTEVSPAGWNEALDALVAGDYWIEQRLMVHAEAWRNGACLRRDDALNDVVISRGAVARSVILEAFIDGVWTTTYNADGLIVATPTGSTAYALAAGGPILPPELENILVIPVAAHLSFDRPIVLDEGATVEVVVAPDTRADVELNVDGERVASLENGDAVIVQSSNYRGQFVRLRDRHYFYRSILDRMEPRMPVRREPDRRSRPVDARRPS